MSIAHSYKMLWWMNLKHWGHCRYQKICDFPPYLNQVMVSPAFFLWKTRSKSPTTQSEALALFFGPWVLCSQQAVIAIAATSMIDEQFIVVVGWIFFKVFAIDDATDCRFTRPEQRHEKTDDESTAKHPHGPIITGAKEPGFEKITIEKDAHPRQNTDAGWSLRGTFSWLQKWSDGDGRGGRRSASGDSWGCSDFRTGCGIHEGAVWGVYPWMSDLDCRYGAVNVIGFHIVLISVKRIHRRHEVDQYVDAQDDEHQQKRQEQQRLWARTLRLHL